MSDRYYSDGRKPACPTSVRPGAVTAPERARPIRCTPISSSTLRSNRFKKQPMAPCSPIAKLYVMAHRYNLHPLQTPVEKMYRRCTWWLECASFAGAQVDIWGDNKQGLLVERDTIKLVGDNAKALADEGEVLVLCKEHGLIAFDVLKASFTQDNVAIIVRIVMRRQ